MEGYDDRNRVKREDVESAYTKRKWNPDSGASPMIISNTMAYAQAIEALKCPSKLATTYLLSATKDLELLAQQ